MQAIQSPIAGDGVTIVISAAGVASIPNGAITAALVAADVATQAELDAHAAANLEAAHPGTISAARVAADVATQAELDVVANALAAHDALGVSAAHGTVLNADVDANAGIVGSKLKAPARPVQPVSVAFAGAGTRYLGWGGYNEAGTATQALTQTVRATAGTAKNFRFKVGANDMVGGNTFVFTAQKNGADTGVTITVGNGDAAGAEIAGAGGNVAYVAEDDLNWKLVSNSANEPEGILSWDEEGA